VIAAGCGVLACAEPPPEQELCAAPGEALDIEVFYRAADEPLADGDSLPVFVPPQGGIATELDVVLRGVGFETVGRVAFEVSRPGDAAVLASSEYGGGGLPLQCVRDGELKLRAVPLPFADGVPLDGLDGMQVVLTARLEHADGSEVADAHAVVLESSAF